MKIALTIVIIILSLFVVRTTLKLLWPSKKYDCRWWQSHNYKRDQQERLSPTGNFIGKEEIMEKQVRSKYECKKCGETFFGSWEKKYL